MKLSIWVVYDHPRDYPNDWVARRQETVDGEIRITNDLVLAKDLATIRDEMLQRGLGYCPRFEGDDPKIFECWL